MNGAGRSMKVGFTLRWLVSLLPLRLRQSSQREGSPSWAPPPPFGHSRNVIFAVTGRRIHSVPLEFPHRARMCFSFLRVERERQTGKDRERKKGLGGERAEFISENGDGPRTSIRIATHTERMANRPVNRNILICHQDQVPLLIARHMSIMVT